MAIDEKPIRSFGELLRATACENAAALEDRINGLMDRNGFVEASWNEDSVEIMVGLGARGMEAAFKFPFLLTDFWALVNDTADEVEEFDD